MFVVCAPDANDALLEDVILDRFAARIADPSTFRFVALDALLGRIREVASDADAGRRAWADGSSRATAASDPRGDVVRSPVLQPNLVATLLRFASTPTAREEDPITERVYAHLLASHRAKVRNAVNFSAPDGRRAA